MSACVLGAAAIPATEPPAAVQQWFDRSGISLAYSIESPRTAAADALRLGRPHQVSQFSDDFASGIEGTPLTAGRKWIAPVLDHGEAIGAVSTTLLPGAVEPSTGGLSNDASLARKLAVASGTIVDDPRTGAWYQVDGTRISALNDAARKALPGSKTLTAFQRHFTDDLAARRAAGNGMLDPVGGAPSGLATDGAQGQYGLRPTWLIAVVAGGIGLVALMVALLVGAARRPTPWERPVSARRSR